ncbi:ADM isoform X2 [Camelus ferus]|uniref:ADM isoform X2 n=1 Tax=Camelus ferus TaxID=419612 RepID=A0A8B8TSH3_CAMFR|nr:ADM isoform X2 [Camelus dromedarius]XP_032344925.1 ADM isoform X2 [Camelus ferus]
MRDPYPDPRTSPPPPHPHRRALRAPECRSARPRKEREGARAAQAPPPCALLIKPRNASRPLSGFLVTLGGTARDSPPLVSHHSLESGFGHCQSDVSDLILPVLGSSPPQQGPLRGASHIMAQLVHTTGIPETQSPPLRQPNFEKLSGEPLGA